MDLKSPSPSPSPSPCADEIENIISVRGDGFSSLPQDVVHHILSPLPISDVIRVGSSSKKYRQICSSSSSLNFVAFPSESTATFEKRSELLSSLDSFLLRRGNHRVQNFHLDWDCQYHCGRETNIPKCWDVETSRVFAWIRNAVDCHVQNLSVSFRTAVVPFLQFAFGGSPQTEFPSDVLTGRSLRSVDLDMKFATIKARNLSLSHHVSNLLRLHLKNVTVEDDEAFCKWISLACIFIKDLVLEDVHGLGNIAVESASMELFKVHFPSSASLCHVHISGEKLERIGITWTFRTAQRKSKSLKISAPNLKYLRWSGNMMSHQNLGDFNFLENVDLDLDEYGVYYMDNTTSHQFLSSIQGVKSLTLNQWSLKTLFKEGCTPPPLLNVSYLGMSIQDFCDESLVPTMVTLFKSLPNLHTLEIIQLNEIGVLNGLTELSLKDRINDVRIEVSYGFHLIEFARYILERAQILKKLVVICSSK
ncbi:hypothetical protein C1H46_016460 [Malus baccata]|uniref:F-box domain-containing protein n=1 Tax=Malus baccata TaxID=106549 RepID=A0A540MGP7_MALBA|nr:hypothetical protein C1H46_016460 [Malus baccata]